MRRASVLSVFVLLFGTVIWFAFAQDTVEVPTAAAHQTQAQNNAKLEQRVSVLEQQVATLQTVVTNLAAEVKALTAKAAQDIAALTARITTTEQQIVTLTEAHAKLSAMVASLEARVTKLEAGQPPPPDTNDAPVAADKAVTLDEDTSTQGQVAATDAEGTALMYKAVSQTSHGTLTFNADGTFTYAPEANYNGADSFTFSANDGELDSNVATVAFTITPVDETEPPPTDSPTRILTVNDLEYTGSFRTPALPAGEDYRTIEFNYMYGMTAMSYNADNDSLFQVGHDHYQLVGEISVPELRDARAGFTKLARSTIIQKMDKPQSRVPNYTLEGNVKVGGTLLTDDKKLVVSLYEYYDADASANESHLVVNPANVSTGAVTGLFRVGTARGGWTGGYMARVPDEWREKLGASYVCGLNGVAITSRTSQGPALIGFDPNDWSKSVELLRYPYTHGQPYSLETLMGYGAWNLSASAHGIVFPENTACVMFIGTIGEGELIYGGGTSDPALHKTKDANGLILAYDPCGHSKGYHAWPYVTRVWVYKVADLMAVRAGTVKSHEVKPVAMFNLDDVLPLKACGRTNGVAYDAKNERIFISQPGNGEWGEPGIHVLKIKDPPMAEAAIGGK